MKHLLSYALLLILFSSLTHAEEEKSPFRAFLNVEYLTYMNSEDLGIKSQEQSGYHIKDAAFYWTHELDAGKLFVELPFSGTYSDKYQDADTNSDFYFAKEKAQAYMSYDFKNWTFKFGQYDAIIGFEGADALDRFFVKEGAISELLPSVHTGLMVSYKINDFNLSLVNSNQNNAGTKADRAYETGLQVAWENDTYRATFNYLLRPQRSTPEESLKSTSMTEIIAGINIQNWAFDLDYIVYTHLDGQNMTDSSGNNINTGSSLLLNGIYTINEKFSSGFRLETVSHMSSLGWAYSTETLGAYYNLTPAIRAGAEYGWLHQTALEESNKVTGSYANFSAHYTF